MPSESIPAHALEIANLKARYCAAADQCANDPAGDWTIKVHSKRRDGGAMEVIGRYADAFRLTDDGWRISKLAFQQNK